MNNTTQVDIAIIGGGIAGLWALNRLNQLGWNTILLESNTLGGGQTIASQGIIHGGMKYSLTGLLSDSAKAIAQMPARWQTCLQGLGEIDLRDALLLSPHQYFWSNTILTGRLVQFFASQIVNSRMQAVPHTQYPEIFKTKLFKGSIYALSEMVLDIPSLIQTLSLPFKEHIFKAKVEKLRYANHLKQYLLSVQSKQIDLNIQAKKIILTAGLGNELLLQDIVKAPRMQKRPLHMVMVKMEKPYTLFGHYVEHSTTPRITITSHTTADGQTIWYLGGRLAEEGILRSQEQQIAFAKSELNALFPWLTFPEHNSHWASFFIDRAENWHPSNKRPIKPFVQSLENLIITWPTKLAFTPQLVDEIILQLKDIVPSTKSDFSSLNILDKPTIAPTIWEERLS